MPPPAPECRLGLLATALILWAACGLTPIPLEGAWTVTDGSTTLVCDGGTVTKPVGGAIVIIDEMHDLAVSIDGDAETLTAEGGGAALEYSPQIVMLTDDAGFEDSWTLTLTSDTLSLVGNTLSENASGTDKQDAYEGEDLICSFKRTLTAIRDPP